MAGVSRSEPALLRGQFLAEYCALAALAGLVRVLPRRAALGLGSALGQLGWLSGLRRQVVLSNLDQALPALAPGQRRRLAAQAARNFGATAVEFLRFPSRDRRRLDELVELAGTEELASTLGEQGRGALVITAHLGAWALYVTALAAAGIPSALVVGRQRNRRVDRFIHAIPGEHVVFIPKGKLAPRQVLRCLGEGRCVVLVADHCAGRAGTRVPFLGREASTLPLPGALIARHGFPLFVMAGHRRADGRHAVWLRKLEIPAHEDENALRTFCAARCNEALGAAILEHPEQYFWYHRRWKLSPALDRSQTATST